MLEIKNLCKSYGDSQKKAVDNLSLLVSSGEIFGFIGPNGAGKTTTIKMITGLLGPDEGSIVVNGYDIVKEPVQAKASMSYVPDNPEMFSKITGKEYLSFMADVYGVSDEDRNKRALKYLELFDLTSVIGNLIGSYSRGMRQKMAIVGALISKPKLLILDEPMVGLDPKSSHLFKDIMNEHCSNGGTVFFSTHVLDVAERLCHRVGIINKGRLIAEGNMAELRKKSREGDVESLENIFLELTEDEN